MRFDCPRKTFSDAVNTANMAAAARTALPIFMTLKVEAQDGQIKVTGSDQSLWIERTVIGSVEEPGSSCLNAKTLVDIINAFPEGDVTLEAGDAAFAKIALRNAEYQLQTMDSEDFVDVPALPSETRIGIQAKALRSAIESVLIAVSPDSHRQVLTGVLISVKEGEIQFVATDTHRLAVKTIKHPGTTEEMSAIVPEKALRAIRALPVGDDDEVVLNFGSGQIGVEANGIRIVSQLLQGTFPAWERIVPASPSRVWTVDCAELSEKVKRAMIIARDSANRLRFEGADEGIIISARSEDKGDAREEVPMVADNGDIAIAFNGKYIQDLLNVVEGEGVRLEMTENTRAAVFKPTDSDSGYFYVVMPMQL